MVVLPGQVLELRSGTGRRGEVCAPRPGQKVTCNAPPDPPKTALVSVDPRRDGASAEQWRSWCATPA